VGASCQRLLALLAIRGRQLNRVQAAGLLWPDVPTARANANLRSALWRLQRACSDVVDSTFMDVWLTDAVITDLVSVQAMARRLLDRSSRLSPGELHQALRCNLQEDILPRLADEPWLSVERERHQQMRLHALEALAEQLTDAGWFGAAVDTALGALRADPFRESACFLLVKAQLAEGNKLEARRQYQRYCAVLRDEMGLEPSESLQRLLGGQAFKPASQRPASQQPASQRPASQRPASQRAGLPAAGIPAAGHGPVARVWPAGRSQLADVPPRNSVRKEIGK
jgi:DNA-binding SARP family transcriptional activator